MLKKKNNNKLEAALFFPWSQVRMSSKSSNFFYQSLHHQVLFSQSTHIFSCELACCTLKLACISFLLQSWQTAAVNNSESEMQAFSVEKKKHCGNAIKHSELQKDMMLTLTSYHPVITFILRLTLTLNSLGLFI